MTKLSRAGARLLIAAAVPIFGLAASPAIAQDHVIMTANEIELQANPDAPFPGEMAVLAGDPSQPGPFVIRFRVSAGTVMTSHSHSSAQHITVLAGKARVAFGPSAEEATAKEVGPGGFVLEPADTFHTIWVDEDLEADLFGIGPYDWVEENGQN